MTEKLYYNRNDGYGGDLKTEHTRLHYRSFDTDDQFFQRVEQYGGWPMDKLWVGFAHSDERECSFTDTNIRGGWHTSIFHRDSYLWWKMTPAMKAEIKKGHRKAFAETIRSMV
jgi:hypothetical protein